MNGSFFCLSSNFSIPYHDYIPVLAVRFLLSFLCSCIMVFKVLGTCTLHSSVHHLASAVQRLLQGDGPWRGYFQQHFPQLNHHVLVSCSRLELKGNMTVY